MILTAMLVLSSPTTDCPDQSSVDASSECRLEQSLRQLPDLDCEVDDSQMAMNVCSFREFLSTDIALNRTWTQVSQRYHKTGGSASTWDAILKAQRAWLTYRDAECDMWRGQYEGGTIAALIANNCLASLTEQRTERLQYLLDDN